MELLGTGGRAPRYHEVERETAVYAPAGFGGGRSEHGCADPDDRSGVIVRRAIRKTLQLRRAGFRDGQWRELPGGYSLLARW